MTVYVDPLMKHGWKMRGQPVRNCHLFTDGQIDELHALASSIGMRRAWFQDKHVPHYDLTAARRRAAVEAGAIEVDRRIAVGIWQRIKISLAALRAAGEDKVSSGAKDALPAGGGEGEALQGRTEVELTRLDYSQAPDGAAHGGAR